MREACQVTPELVAEWMREFGVREDYVEGQVFFTMTREEFELMFNAKWADLK